MIFLDFSTKSYKSLLISDIQSGQYALLYASLEMLHSSFWHDILAEENFEQCKLISLAFDEAHTLTSYPDFRHKYKFLPEIMTNLNPEISVHLLSATCSGQTLKDICEILGMNECELLKVTKIADR